MWFKNLKLYRLSTPFTLSGEELHERLSHSAYRPCGSLEPTSYGWVSPLGRHGSLLTHTASDCIMVCARRDDKILPASVIKEFVDDKVVAIEEEQGRPVRRKERERLREEVVLDLLPRAFVRATLTYAYISPRDSYLVVDTPTAGKAEDLASLLRDSLGSLPAVPVSAKHAPAPVMTGWLAGGGVPQELVIGDECELREPGDEGGIVRWRRMDPVSEEVQVHLRSGKQAVKLAVTWADRLSCVLGEDLSVKRLRFTDLVQEERTQTEAEGEVARFDADFGLLTLELGRFIPWLLDTFGGEDQEAYAPSGQAA